MRGFCCTLKTTRLCAWFQRAYSFTHKKLLCYYVRDGLATVLI